VNRLLCNKIKAYVVIGGRRAAGRFAVSCRFPQQIDKQLMLKELLR